MPTKKKNNFQKKKKKKKKTKNRTTIQASTPLLDIYIYISKKMKALIQKDTHTLMFIAVLFIIVKIYKQPTCPPTEEWIKIVCVQWNST